MTTSFLTWICFQDYIILEKNRTITLWTRDLFFGDTLFRDSWGLKCTKSNIVIQGHNDRGIIRFCQGDLQIETVVVVRTEIKRKNVQNIIVIKNEIF